MTNEFIQHLLRTESSGKWQRIGLCKRAGVLVPLFSVYSAKSTGIGDFSDLRLLIDWAEQTGNSLIQLLPMNELSSIFCPYDSLSSFALEPAYINLGQAIEKGQELFQERIERLRSSFCFGKGHLDYRIKDEKVQLLRDIFDETQALASVEVRQFSERNSYWLNDFTLFKMLKEHHRGLPWYEWEDSYKNRDKDKLKDFSNQHQNEIAFQAWLQWLAFKQFKEVKSYAESKNILIQGDLPVLVSRDSADVWQHQEFFKLEYAAGAPPDMYCAKGQRWGMPTYNWDNISTDNYRYLKEKIRYAENFYDILRVDHVVGLFRIWSIPYHEPLENQGLNGFFDPQDEAKWEGQARQILSIMLENTKMLLCAEDLGVIPKVCPETLQGLGIPGCDIQRWVKDWNISHDFLKPKDYRLLSVAALSTHDTTNWAAWWENEAGTVDEELFIRKCGAHKINYVEVKTKLFDLGSSRHGRLRWIGNVSRLDILTAILGRRKEDIADLIEMYENSYQEKEKLWRRFGLSGSMPERSNRDIIRAALNITLNSRAIFSIQLILDWLLLAGLLKGDPFQYRINTPGTVSRSNWSLVLSISLDELLQRHDISQEIKKLIAASGRI